jgi:glyoxylate reductase
MKPKVYITRSVPQAIINRLSDHCEIRMWERDDTPVPREILEKEIENIDGLLCLLTETIDDGLLNHAKNLKIIANIAVGFNNIDIESATKRGIMVTNTPGVLTETTADLTFGLLMATARRLIEASDNLKNGDWKSWSLMQLTGQDVYGAKLGIIGLGRIGEALVKRAKGFDMEVLYYNRSRKVEKEKELGITYASLNDLLKESDFVCIMTPYSDETKNLINTRQLALMKENAILVNTARGGIVNETALYEALKNKVIWGAGLDVFEVEPVPLNHPLLTLPNVVTLPHIGSASIATRMKMANLAVENLISGLKNGKPRNLINDTVIKII